MYFCIQWFSDTYATVHNLAVSIHLDGEERAGCFALCVFLVSRNCCVALPHDTTGLSAVCFCGISYYIGLEFFVPWSPN